MKMSTLLALLFLCAHSAANAQTDMSCADLLKANKQMDASVKQTMDSDSAAMDKKVNDYCTNNPKAKASEAMEKALAD